MLKKKLVTAFASIALAVGPLLLTATMASANDQLDAYNSSMEQYRLLWSQGKVADANAAYARAQNQWIIYQTCLAANSCTTSAVKTIPSPTSTPTSQASSNPSSTPVSGTTISPTPAPTQIKPSSSPSPSMSVESSQAPSTKTLMTFSEYTSAMQALDLKIVSASGAERTALLAQKSALEIKYQSDHATAQQNYVKVQTEYVEQLAVVNALSQSESQLQLIRVATDQAINAGVSADSLTSWTAAQAQLQAQVDKLQSVVSNFETMFTADAIAGMTLETTDETVATAIAYQTKLKQEALNLTSLAITSISSVPTSDLTAGQTQILISAANVGFRYAEPDSTVYRQSLDALLLVAQSDDPELNPSVAAIPMLGEAAQTILDAFNSLGNIGSDMSPQVRQDSESVVVSAVIASQVAQVAVGAAHFAGSSATMAGAAAFSRRP